MRRQEKDIPERPKMWYKLNAKENDFSFSTITRAEMKGNLLTWVEGPSVFVLLEDGAPDIAGSRSYSQQNECRTQGFRLHPNSVSSSKSPNPLSFSDIRHTKSVSDLPLPQLHDAIQCFGFRPQTTPYIME
jgi:hypothetical protein